MSDTPEIHKVRDAEVRVYDCEPADGDASDMYVMEVLGVTVYIHLARQTAALGGGERNRTKVTVETDAYPVDAEVCGVESTYGEGWPWYWRAYPARGTRAVGNDQDKSERKNQGNDRTT